MEFKGNRHGSKKRSIIFNPHDKTLTEKPFLSKKNNFDYVKMKNQGHNKVFPSCFSKTNNVTIPLNNLAKKKQVFAPSLFPFFKE